MRFRVVRFRLDTGEYETLATNLGDDFTTEDIKMLYHLRWKLELGFRNVKYSAGLLNIHGKSADYAKQEVYSSLILHNFAVRIVNQIALRQNMDGNGNRWEYAVNLKMVIYLCRLYLQSEDTDGEKLMQDMARYVEPIRPDRADERRITPKNAVPFTYRISS